MSKATLISREDLDGLTVEQKVAFVAKTCEMILESPEKNLAHFHSLLRLLKDSAFVVVKLTAVSVAEVLRNVVPLYRIDRAEAEEKLKQMIKKDERKTLTFELELLGHFEKFFQAMNEIRGALSELTRGRRDHPGRPGHLPAVQRGAGVGVHPAVREAVVLQPRGGGAGLHPEVPADGQPRRPTADA